MNKCSLDLMLLLIEEAKKQICQTPNEIAILGAEISTRLKTTAPL